jgi:hypothetical protein
MSVESSAATSTSRWLVALSIVTTLIGLALLWPQYVTIKRSYFDDTFIYLHVAQNAVELGTWQYFPNTERPALVASSPLKAIVLTLATAIAWPFTGGERSLAAAGIVLPIAAMITPLLFLPFWWRDRRRFLLLLAPYALLAAALDAVVEFEAGLIYWWIATIIRNFVERKDDRMTHVAVVLGPLVRPDVGVIGLLALLLAHQSRADRLPRVLHNWIVASLAAAIVWSLICWAFGVWPIPTTYWTKAALPKLFDSSFMVTFFVERMGSVALGVAPWASRSFASALALFWIAMILIIVSRSQALGRWRAPLLVGFVVLLLSRTPANFWWYYQNALVAFVAIALAVLVTQRDAAARAACWALVITVIAVVVPSRSLREPQIMWHFDTPSRAQGYLSMARTFAPDGTIELPGLGRGYLNSLEIGITSYFGGRNAFIWDNAGLAQAQPDALKSKLRFFYPARLRELPDKDVERLAKDRPDVQLFVAWAMESRDPKSDVHGNCKHMLFDRAVCVSDVRKWR